MTRFEIIVRKYIVKNGGYPPTWAAAPGIKETLKKLVSEKKISCGKCENFFIPARINPTRNTK
jgi:hypothetical protein